MFVETPDVAEEGVPREDDRDGHQNQGVGT